MPDWKSWFSNKPKSQITV